VRADYAFLDELEALRPRVKGAGSRDRFDYWLHTFRYMRAASHIRCVWAQRDAAIKKMTAEKDADAKKQIARNEVLPLHIEIVTLMREVYRHLLPTVSTTGELGTVANFEQHIIPGLIDKPGEVLAKALGEPLPVEAKLEREYPGPPRLIVPTVRTSVAEGETLNLKVIVLAKAPPSETALYWRPLAMGEFGRIPLTHVARGVYTVELPDRASGVPAFEYYIEARADDQTLRFPVTAPSLNQTVVVAPVLN
jgi:hypothetical protein